MCNGVAGDPAIRAFYYSLYRRESGYTRPPVPVTAGTAEAQYCDAMWTHIAPNYKHLSDTDVADTVHEQFKALPAGLKQLFEAAVRPTPDTVTLGAP